MIEKEKLFLSIPRRSRRNSNEESNNQGKDPKIEIVKIEPPQTSKQIDEIIERLEEEAQEEPIEKGSYFEDSWVGATSYHSYAKKAREESKELHNEEYLKKIT